jgi:hypothetical protein
LEDQVWAQEMFCCLKVAVTSTGQQNYQHNSTTVCVLLTAKERAESISAPYVMWDCVLWLVLWNITQK